MIEGCQFPAGTSFNATDQYPPSPTADLPMAQNPCTVRQKAVLGGCWKLSLALRETVHFLTQTSINKKSGEASARKSRDGFGLLLAFP